MLLLEDLRQISGFLEDPRVPLWEERKRLYSEVKNVKKLFELAAKVKTKYDFLYVHKKNEYEKVDRRLAFIDGRYKVIVTREVEKMRGDEKRRDKIQKTAAELIEILTPEQKKMLREALMGELK